VVDKEGGALPLDRLDLSKDPCYLRGEWSDTWVTLAPTHNIVQDVHPYPLYAALQAVLCTVCVGVLCVCVCVGGRGGGGGGGCEAERRMQPAADAAYCALHTLHHSPLCQDLCHKHTSITPLPHLHCNT
jgi:hypothetical protein